VKIFYNFQTLLKTIVRVTLLNVEGKLTKKEACSNDQIKGKNYQKWENID
jgi:hypothetical protein